MRIKNKPPKGGLLQELPKHFFENIRIEYSQKGN